MDVETIVVTKKCYDDMRATIKRQKKEIEKLSHIIDQGDVAITVELIRDLEKYIEKATPRIFCELRTFSIGKMEQEALIELENTINVLLSEIRTFLDSDLDDE